MRARAIPNFGRRRSRQSTEPKAVLEHRAPKTSLPILHTRGVESKVGRAVHCAPVWVVLTRLLGARILPSAPLRARLRLTAETLRRRVKVGRAVHCASGLGTQTRLPGLNLVFPRPYGRGYVKLKKHTVGNGLPRPARDRVFDETSPPVWMFGTFLFAAGRVSPPNYRFNALTHYTPGKRSAAAQSR